MEAKTMITERRSVRKYTEEKVSHDTMREIIDMARWAPSWANTQIARYTVVEDEELIARIAEEGVHGFVYNKGTLKHTKGVVVLSYVKGKSGKISASKSGDNDMNFGEIWEMFDAGIACQTFCLAAHEKGVGTCIMGVVNQEKIAEIISLPEGERVAAVITYGYEAGEHAKPVPRKEVKDILRIAGE